MLSKNKNTISTTTSQLRNERMLRESELLAVQNLKKLASLERCVGLAILIASWPEVGQNTNVAESSPRSMLNSRHARFNRKTDLQQSPFFDRWSMTKTLNKILSIWSICESELSTRTTAHALVYFTPVYTFKISINKPS